MMKTKFDYTASKARIHSMFGSVEAFAAKMGMTADNLTRTLENKDEFTLDELYRAVDLLEINAPDIVEFFFKAA